MGYRVLSKEDEEEIQKPSPSQKVIDRSFDDFADLMTWLDDFTSLRFNVGNIAFYCHIDHMQILTRHDRYTVVLVYHQTTLVKLS